VDEPRRGRGANLSDDRERRCKVTRFYRSSSPTTFDLGDFELIEEEHKPYREWCGSVVTTACVLWFSLVVENRSCNMCSTNCESRGSLENQRR
jgi:hypothetical protein